MPSPRSHPTLAAVAFHASAAHWYRPGHAPSLVEPHTTQELLWVRVGALDYALPLIQVESLKHHREGQVALEDGAVLGRPPLLLDLAELLGREGGPSAPARTVVVLARGERRLGLVVDQVLGALKVLAGEWHPPACRGGFADRHCLAETQIGGRALRLLSADTWFALADSPFIVLA